MSQTELAGALGITQPQLSRWIKKGCPEDTKENAEQWIRANINQRKRTISLKAPRKGSKLLPATLPVEDVNSWESRLKRARHTELSLYD